MLLEKLNFGGWGVLRPDSQVGLTPGLDGATYPYARVFLKKETVRSQANWAADGL